MQQTKQKECPYRHLSVDLIRGLYGAHGQSISEVSPKLSLTKIRQLSGAPWSFIKQSINDPDSIIPGTCRCRYCPDKDLTQDEVEYLCSNEVLKSQRTFSLLQRTLMFQLRFPGRRISIRKLRQVYKLNHIKLRVLKFNQQLTTNQINSMNKSKREVLPRVIQLIEKHQNIVFVDEAVFTSGQIQARYWAKSGDTSLKIEKKKLGFKAIAVVAAINIQGRVVALLIKDKSIITSDFQEFLKKLKSKMYAAKTYIFLDNLVIHHTHIIASEARKNNQQLIFNAAYSSHLNPIERLWALAKRQFIKDCVNDADFKSQEEVKAFVAKTILEASAETLEKHVFNCVRLMKSELQLLNNLI